MSRRPLVVSVIGARPQFVKAAVVTRALRRHVDEVLIHTGQHYDDALSDLFFRELDIPLPDRNLGIGSLTHGAQIGRMLEQVERELLEIRPDGVVVYGDTNSTVAGALAAAKLKIPVAHIEAGLRSYNRDMPEEINRVVTDHLAALLFAPTDIAVSNLRKEGIPEDRIHHVGDVMLDAARHFGAQAALRSNILERLGLAPGAYVLATLHRAENTDDPRRFLAVLEGLAAASECLPVVFPVHPRTRAAITSVEPRSNHCSRLQLIEPVGYLDMLMLERHARVIATDSGGVQKEAYFHAVPCVTLRAETEWVDLVEQGWNRLAPPVSGDAVRAAILDAINDGAPAERPDLSLYGNGEASARIADVLASFLCAS